MTLLTGKEAIKLYQELEVDIFALWSLAVAAPNVMAIEIDGLESLTNPVVAG